jgi:hypothetical protein
MSALIIAIIMMFIGGVCLSRAISRERVMEGEDRRAFLIFCGAFGAVCMFQGFTTSGDALVLAARILAGVMLLASAAIAFNRA